MSSFSLIAPLRTRRSSCMCPPTPNNNPRWTHNVRMYVPASQLTQNTAKFLWLSNSRSLLSWIVRIRNCRFTAEMRGGRWNNAPVRVSRARGRAFSDSRALCKRRTQTYSLPGEDFSQEVLGLKENTVPAPCWLLTNRVALSMQTIKQPVTFGSRVPLCPVFSTRRIRLIQATTS